MGVRKMRIVWVVPFVLLGIPMHFFCFEVKLLYGATFWQHQCLRWWNFHFCQKLISQTPTLPPTTHPEFKFKVPTVISHSIKCDRLFLLKFGVEWRLTRMAILWLIIHSRGGKQLVGKIWEDQIYSLIEMEKLLVYVIWCFWIKPHFPPKAF